MFLANSTRGCSACSWRHVMSWLTSSHRRNKRDYKTLSAGCTNTGRSEVNIFKPSIITVSLWRHSVGHSFILNRKTFGFLSVLCRFSLQLTCFTGNYNPKMESYYSTIHPTYHVPSVYLTGHPRWGANSPASSKGRSGAKSSCWDHRGMQSRVGQRNAIAVCQLHQWASDQRAQGEPFRDVYTGTSADIMKVKPL